MICYIPANTEHSPNVLLYLNNQKLTFSECCVNQSWTESYMIKKTAKLVFLVRHLLPFISSTKLWQNHERWPSMRADKASSLDVLKESLWLEKCWQTVHSLPFLSSFCFSWEITAFSASLESKKQRAWLF